MVKTVLLARPHPFIVSDMGPFLSAAGFHTIQLRDLRDLRDLPNEIAGASGVVMSLALVTKLGASADDVYQALRKHAPNVPLVFAGLLDMSKAKFAMTRLVSGTEPTPRFISSGAGPDAGASLGGTSTILYLGKEDLTDSARREQAMRNIALHFR